MHALPLLVLLAAAPQAPALVQIAGIVRDATGLPLVGATVEVDDVLVAVSDDTGEFQISLAAGSRPSVRVRLPGFESYDSVVDLRPGVRLDVSLTLGRMQDRVTVAAPEFTQVAERTFAVEPLHAYRTPGGRRAGPSARSRPPARPAAGPRRSPHGAAGGR